MAGMMQQVQAPLLRTIVQNVERGLHPDVVKSYRSGMAAAMTILWGQQFDKQREEYLANIRTPEDVPKLVSHGIVKLIALVQNESKLREPMAAAGPVAIVLMCQVLEYLEKKLKMEMPKAVIDETTHLIGQGLFHLYGITPQMIQDMAKGKARAGQQATAAPPQAPAPGQPAPSPTPPRPPMPQPPAAHVGAPYGTA